MELMMETKRVKRSRLMIRADMLEKELTICFKDIKTRRCFCYPVDAFFDWLREHTECLETSSWQKKGIYNWPYVPERYFAFLDQYEVTAVPEGIPTSQTRDYRPNERLDDLREYKKVLGHCYVPEPGELLYDEVYIAAEMDWHENRVRNLMGFAMHKRRQYRTLKKIEYFQKRGLSTEEIETELKKEVYGGYFDTDSISEEELTELRELGFIFETSLIEYFEQNPNPDHHHYAKDYNENRAYLINVLMDIQSKKGGKK